MATDAEDRTEDRVTVAADDELLGAWRAGDAEAGRRLFERHYDAVYRFFASKVDRDVDDLVQGTFLACVEAVGRFEGRSTFRTFLLGIAYNLLHQRMRMQVRDFDPEVSSLADVGISPSMALWEREQRRLVHEALRRLSLDHQVLLELYFLERVTAPELADVLGVPVNTVRSRLMRAKQAFRQAFVALR